MLSDSLSVEASCDLWDSACFLFLPRGLVWRPFATPWLTMLTRRGLFGACLTPWMSDQRLRLKPFTLLPRTAPPAWLELPPSCSLAG